MRASINEHTVYTCRPNVLQWTYMQVVMSSQHSAVPHRENWDAIKGDTFVPWKAVCTAVACLDVGNCTLGQALQTTTITIKETRETKQLKSSKTMELSPVQQTRNISASHSATPSVSAARIPRQYTNSLVTMHLQLLWRQMLACFKLDAE
jgi:hypothetical protein